MKVWGGAALIMVLAGCAVEDTSDGQQSSSETSTELDQAGAAASVQRQDTRKPVSDERKQLPLWQSVSPMIGTSEEEAKALVTRVLAKHNAVASDENVMDLVGALLTFKDQDNVDPKRVLDCMDSGVRSPTGPQWQDTIAYCVTELAS